MAVRGTGQVNILKATRRGVASQIEESLTFGGASSGPLKRRKHLIGYTRENQVMEHATCEQRTTK